MPVTYFCTRFVGLFFATSALLVVSSCGGGGGGSSAPVAPTPTPAQLTSINLSQDTLTLDRWGDSVTISAQAVDQNGNNVSDATITWSSPDTDIAAVDNAGNVTTWLAGDIDLTVEAAMGGITVSETVAVTVAIQRNTNCQVPTEFPVKGPVAPPRGWDARDRATQFGPEEFHYDYQITLDVDRDGDPDLLPIAHTQTRLGVGVPLFTTHRVWLNDGSGHFTDGTDAILGQNSIPWNGPRDMDYADFDGDGFQDVVVFQTGWERTADCGIPGSCPGGPNLLFLPQPDGLIDSAPTRLSPYDTDGFTHSGAVGDVDCDGDIDIFEAQFVNPGAPGVHHLQLNSGVGTFVADASLLPQELFSAPDVPGDPDVQAGIAGSVLCDLDRDGDPDLVYTLANTDLVTTRIAVNDGFGRFRMLDPNLLPAIVHEDPNLTFAEQADCADLDLNGYNDIVLNAGYTFVLKNHGDMSFTDVTSSILPPNPVGLTANGLGIIDLNNDGWPELTPEWKAAVYWNTGDGVFTELPFREGSSALFTTVADFDMDGWPDIYHHWSNTSQAPNHLYINVPAVAPVKLMFATSSLYSADLGGLSGADAICQQHADGAELPGTYVAYLSDSNTNAISRISWGEYHRPGDNALVFQGRPEIRTVTMSNPVGHDENGTFLVVPDEYVRTGTDHNGTKFQDTGIGFCSDWNRATDEDPAGSAYGDVTQANVQWSRIIDPNVLAEKERNCSEPLRLYCFQE